MEVVIAHPLYKDLHRFPVLNDLGYLLTKPEPASAAAAGGGLAAARAARAATAAPPPPPLPPPSLGCSLPPIRGAIRSPQQLSPPVTARSGDVEEILLAINACLREPAPKPPTAAWAERPASPPPSPPQDPLPPLAEPARPKKFVIKPKAKPASA